MAAGRNGEALSQYEAGLARDPNNARALAAVQKLQTTERRHRALGRPIPCVLRPRSWAGQVSDFDSHDLDEEGIRAKNSVDELQFGAPARAPQPTGSSAKRSRRRRPKSGKLLKRRPRRPERAASRLDRARALLIAALVACATLPYLNILFNGFVYDDDTQVIAESVRPELPLPEGNLYHQRLVFQRRDRLQLLSADDDARIPCLLQAVRYAGLRLPSWSAFCSTCSSSASSLCSPSV